MFLILKIKIKYICILFIYIFNIMKLKIKKKGPGRIELPSHAPKACILPLNHEPLFKLTNY